MSRHMWNVPAIWFTNDYWKVRYSSLLQITMLYIHSHTLDILEEICPEQSFCNYILSIKAPNLHTLPSSLLSKQKVPLGSLYRHRIGLSNLPVRHTDSCYPMCSYRREDLGPDRNLRQMQKGSSNRHRAWRIQRAPGYVHHYPAHPTGDETQHAN